jgi:UDP-glucose 4-epimerase
MSSRRVTVTGASGNVGTALLRRLDDALAGADAAVHLAWLIQPGRDEALLERVNVGGTQQVVEAVRRHRVPHLVHASSVGAYRAGSKEVPVDESWPTDGITTSSYSRHKVAAERVLDQADVAQVARLRPGLIFQRDAASEIARYFLGPLVPARLLGARVLTVLPLPDQLVFQAVHADDVASAIVAVLDTGATGAFNLAAAPVLTPRLLGDVIHARRVRVPAEALRKLASVTYRAHLQPTEPGWLDLALGVPLLDTSRARDLLDWHPRHGADEAVAALLAGLRRGAGTGSAALAPRRAPL